MPRKTVQSSNSLFNFGPLAREYDRWYATPAGRVHDRLQKEDVAKLLPPARFGERLLDVGCGTGHWSRFFASLGYSVHGIDVSWEMIAVAQSAGIPGCTFEVADASGLPFGDASFDVVAAMAMLEFTPDPVTAVREMVRCTKPGGRVLIGTLNRLAPLNRHRLSKGRQPYASGHLFTPNELRTLLAPWGKVRMVASSVRDRKTRSLLPMLIAGRLTARRGRFRGAFIVAEVRR